MSPSDSKGQELQQSVKKDNVAKATMWQKGQFGRSTHEERIIFIGKSNGKPR